MRCLASIQGLHGTYFKRTSQKRSMFLVMGTAFDKILFLYMREGKMEIITFLERLAGHVHYDVGLDNLIDQQLKNAMF